MPPKHRRSCPIVVGTVSTRSTRRESIVNIEILPKGNKSTKKSNKKSPIETDIAMSENKIEEKVSKNKEILEILKDWSDDDSSQEMQRFSTDESSNVLEIFNDNDINNFSSVDDKQSLIDILEGNQSIANVKNRYLQSKSDNYHIGDPVIEGENSNDQEGLIIEECIVDDESVIIEMPEGELLVEEMQSGIEKNNIADEDTLKSVGAITENNFIKSVEAVHKEVEVLPVPNTTMDTEIMDISKPVSETNIGGLTPEEQVIGDETGTQVARSPIIIEPTNLVDEYMEVIEETVVDYSEDISVQSDSYITEEVTDDNKSATSDESSQSMETVGDDDNSSENISIPILENNPTIIKLENEILLKSEHIVSEPVVMQMDSSKTENDEISMLNANIQVQLNISNENRESRNETVEVNGATCSNKNLLSKMPGVIEPERSPIETIQCSENQNGSNYTNTTKSASHTQNDVSEVKVDNTEMKMGLDPNHINESVTKDANTNDSNEYMTDTVGKSIIVNNEDNTATMGDNDTNDNIDIGNNDNSSNSDTLHEHVNGSNEYVSSTMGENVKSDVTGNVGENRNNNNTEDLSKAMTTNAEVNFDATIQSAESIITDSNMEIDEKYENKNDAMSAVLGEQYIKNETLDSSMDVKEEIPKGKKAPVKGKKTNQSNTDQINKSRSRRSGRKKDSQLTKAADESIIILESDSTEVPSTPKVQSSVEKLQQKSNKFTKKSRESKPVDAKKGKSKISFEGSESFDEVRRSNRIKSISRMKKRSTHGLVKSKSDSLLSEGDISDNNESEKMTPIASPKTSGKDKPKLTSKLKDSSIQSENKTNPAEQVEIKPQRAIPSKDEEIKERLKGFVHLKENFYKTDRQVCKEAKEMACDCYLAEQDIQNGEFGCGDDCLNRLLMIECGDLCQVGQRCTNKRFQKGQFAPVEVFKTEKKGLGLRAAANIPYGEFILEYVGEVLDPDEFDKRAEVYSEDKNIHHYFMSLRADAIIDATVKGNISRFINHSCDPNAETQKWTVNGELRIGFFSTRTILAGEEVTFDYRFQRYGREAQKCYCEAAACRGWLGERPDESEEEDEDEEADKEDIRIVGGEKDAGKDLKRDSHTKNLLVAGEKDAEKESKFSETHQNRKDVESPSIGKFVTTSKPAKRKPRKEILEDLDLNEEIEMLITTGLKNQAHTLKLSRLMVRAKEPEQRKKLLHILRRGELPCRRLFLDYHGLRLMHGYMIDAEQLAIADRKFVSAKLELLQTLAVLPIQNKTMLIESKVLPAVEKMSMYNVSTSKREEKADHKEIADKEEEIKFLAKKLLEEWANLKESFRIPKKERIEQMKEHEKEANRKFMASSYSQEQESSRKSDHRYRTWSRYKSERESSSKKSTRLEDRDKPSAAFLKISKHERRKLFALQMELKEEERRLKQREMWRQHEMNCMIIGTDPRFTAPFDPNKGFQYIWSPSIGQWQALPVSTSQGQGIFPAATTQIPVPAMNVPPPQRPPLLATYSSPLINNITGLPSSSTPLSGINLPSLPVASDVTQQTIPTTHQVFSEIKNGDDVGVVKFAGPIPPPVKLPSKWKSAKDKYGRPYYYHIKIRKSQWEPPPLIPEKIVASSPSSSSDTSSLSSDSSSDSDTDGEIDDTKLLKDVRKQMDKVKSSPKLNVAVIKQEDKCCSPSPEIKEDSEEELKEQDLLSESIDQDMLSSIDIRLKEQFNWDSDRPPPKKKRVGLCQEIIISPRSEEDHLQFKEDMKRYKANKEKLKRQKDLIMAETRKKLKLSLNDEDLLKKGKDKKLRSSVKSRIKEISSFSNDAKKIKENFRSNMATTVVGVLNAYRKPDCKEGRITNTEDFKHLARKLTHFVMLKEMKHIDNIEELTCTDNVKAKAREYIKKYMGKFGETYLKKQDEPDFKD
ncbi:variant-silencing SET domain-containing protein [Cylas formicarius]|uniref:variant-silencing SET domain-containing protein n=1 Tax=Cylas formicarius TaxID=197179 RepID=UPI0029585DDC|nr:variant-silencing SET domain-containing protein [Cylas formicarius]